MVAAAAPEIERMRPRLLSRFRGLSDADLAVAGVFMVASKPGSPAAPGGRRAGSR